MKKTLIFLVFLIFYNLCACKNEQTATLKVMSYNIRHGEGLDSILEISRSERIIKSHSPDLCGLQEVDKFCSRSDSIDQTDYLAQKISMEGTFGKFMAFQGGEYGMATLSRKPLISTKALELPNGKYEPRCAIVHEVQLEEDCIIAFANVHFDWIGGEEGDTNRLNQAKALVKYLDDLGRATIITGDFNCSPDSPTMQYFAQQGFNFMSKGDDNLSFQGSPKSEIDHLIYRNKDGVKFKNKSIELIDELVVSDHRPLVAELNVIF